MASVLAGRSVPVDFADASGMNLLNLKTKEWDKRLADAAAPGLLNKPALGSSFFNSCRAISQATLLRKYGFNPACRIAVWSGDNPNSLVGISGGEPGTAIISLGTSDTLMVAFDHPVTDPNGYGHVFCKSRRWLYVSYLF